MRPYRCRKKQHHQSAVQVKKKKEKKLQACAIHCRLFVANPTSFTGSSNEAPNCKVTACSVCALVVPTSVVPRLCSPRLCGPRLCGPRLCGPHLCSPHSLTNRHTHTHYRWRRVQLLSWTKSKIPGRDSLTWLMQAGRLGPSVKLCESFSSLNALTLGPSLRDSITEVWPDIERLSDNFAVTPCTIFCTNPTSLRNGKYICYSCNLQDHRSLRG